jgi:hypothetical protein
MKGPRLCRWSEPSISRAGSAIAPLRVGLPSAPSAVSSFRMMPGAPHGGLVHQWRHELEAAPHAIVGHQKATVLGQTWHVINCGRDVGANAGRVAGGGCHNHMTGASVLLSHGSLTVPLNPKPKAVHAPAGTPWGSSGGRSRGLWLRRSAGSSTLWQGRAPSGRLLGGASSQGWCSCCLMCGAAGVQHTECRVLRHSQCAAACWVGGCVLRGTGGTGGCSGAVTVRGMRDCACRVAL